MRILIILLLLTGCTAYKDGSSIRAWDPTTSVISQLRVDAKVGDLYIFPYTLLHGVYPFNGTDEIRRTMSYNCNLYKPAVIKQVTDQQMKEADKNA